MFKPHGAVLHGFVLLKRKPLLRKWEDDADRWKIPWDGEEGSEEGNWMSDKLLCLISIIVQSVHNYGYQKLYKIYRGQRECF